MKNKKVWIIISLIIVVLLAAASLFAYFYVKKNKDITFKLKGDKEVTISLLEKYKDEGYTLTVNNKKEKAVTSNKLDNTKVGTYKIKYVFVDKFKHKHTLERIINVVDDISPELTLKGSNKINILVGEEYKEFGYEVLDNYDKEENIDVQVENDINNKKKGTYTVKYTATDKSGNSVTIERVVNVITPKKVVVVTEDKSTEKETKVETLVVSHENTITENKFTNDGVVITGYLKNNASEDIIHLKNESSDITFPMTKNGEYYSGTITFTEVPNGVYTLYINEIPLKNNMEVVNRIVRSKVGDKLITFNYDDGVALSVEDFSYQYDLLIDVGHGGSDNGASNKYIYEKEMNLIISKYEKCRYEEMGLKVQLVREDDTYGNMMGPENWNVLTRRAYYMGYYGAVSRIVYSNHNNSTPSSKVKGFEILTPAVSDLSREVKILNDVKLAFPNEETSARAYARNYYGGGIYTSSAGQNYDFKNYYAVIRVPYELYNTKVVIYEGAYLSNLDDFEFFWNEGNWKKISEIKIKNYVEELGKEYIETTTCS